MNASDDFEIFLAATPGLESALADEAWARNFQDPAPVPGGVTLRGGWPEIWRANLELRGAGRVLARIGGFRAMHLAQLDKRARKFPWGEVLRPDVPVRIEATANKSSRIYHAGAVVQRVETAIRETLGAPISDDAAVRVMARVEDDMVTFSIDTSGEPLHKRGHKEEVGKAPMRETMAAMFLRACGYDGQEPVVDPMCGSGTFVIEAAEIAAGLHPGRSRAFAFEQLASFDPAAWAQLKGRDAPVRPTSMFRGSDRDAGAARMSAENAARAGVADFTEFTCHAVSDLMRPEGRAGLVIVNPPYGARIGDVAGLRAVYGALGKTLLARFAGWRVGMVTSEPALAYASGLPFTAGPNVLHGGLKVQLFQTGRLG